VPNIPTQAASLLGLDVPLTLLADEVIE